ncbi:MAG: PglZ domain-containing protein [Flavobacteriales bacterium]|jgi:CheY-like chemotaxis protein|nr:PglZ domain-containing protein [Flavobacteriales bacterium]
MAKILWADDEIDLLKPHIMFLEAKGHNLTTVNSGSDAVDEINESNFDIVFLDENMPGLTGLETLEQIKAKHPSIPIVMITKSEEESIMEEAIGGRISDYLIKPVNPNQILLSIKKNLEGKRLVSEKTTSSYQQEFRQISMDLQDRMDEQEWAELYKKIVYWDLELAKSNDESMKEILNMQKREANDLFSRFVEKNYLNWVNGIDAPLLSHQLLQKEVFPKLGHKTTFLVVIDNLRYDQWRVLRPLLREYFNIDSEDLYYGILPTATQYARNALFAGMMPAEIAKKLPQYWKNDEDEGGKNLFEKELLAENLKRHNINKRFSYHKITNLESGKKLADNFSNLLQNDFNAIVYNFVDMLSHARTDMEVIRELADDEAAYRSLTLSWFEHSPLFDIFKLIAQNNCDVIVTTDHGTIKVDEPSKVVGDRNTNTNLRYKQGKNLTYEKKDVFEVRKPEDAFLPKQNVSTTFVFAKDSKFFVYPNNYNHYLKYYKHTFQHGGISLEEVLIPIVHLKSK